MNFTSHLRNRLAVIMLMSVCVSQAIDHPGITFPELSEGRFTLVESSSPVNVCVDPADDSAVRIAAGNLCADFGRVTGNEAALVDMPEGRRVIIAGTVGTPLIDRLIADGKISGSDLKGKNEKYIMKVVSSPADGVDEALVIVGSDRRGTVYGIYELSEQIGVSPWYDWADVPVARRENLSIEKGTYMAGEPAVRYRGIFLNDEAPCLTGWVKNTYGTGYGDHRFYERVFELILRLRGNFLWPAMWGWAFYADDAENGPTADRMGVIIGTSHHEPMARNHQEWARNRKNYGAWNYATNKKVLDKFFAEGVARAKGTEDVITIGMRGDGDEAMSAEADVKLLEKIIDNQRRIIKKETGRPAHETPQVWALYKEVLDYYDAGLRVPDDVTLLLCDDNWGNVRRLPDEKERKHPGGWGMYYHVDYVGAPRNSKLLNCTPIQNMWEQMQLTYDYGVDRLWILNVGDLKPMEYPITLFLDMAWNPHRYDASSLLEHTEKFCAQQFGEENAAEAARILNLLCKYNGRVTPEMLDRRTYSLESGEWRKVADGYARLEAEALRQYMTIAPECRDAYQQIIMFPIQLMGNLYDMYYAQAMNHELYRNGDPEANMWADRVEACFKRDAELMNYYNKVMSGGKWDGMMTQKHIGYKSWDDSFAADTLPEIHRVEVSGDNCGGYSFSPSDGYISMEAQHYYKAVDPESGARWTVIPHMGRTLSGLSVMPYTESVDGARLEYSMTLPEDVREVKVLVVLKSTLAFANIDGHRYSIGFKGGESEVVNYNGNLNEAPKNIYSVFYPTVARRVVEKSVSLPVPSHKAGEPVVLELSPLDPGVVFEKIVVDFGGYSSQYLHGEESPHVVRK